MAKNCIIPLKLIMSLNKFFQPVNFFAAFVNLLVIVLMIVLIITHKNLPPKLPLWFSLNWGEERLALPSSLWILPLLASFYFVGGLVIGKLINKTYPIISQILVWATAFLSIVFLLSVYKIVLLVS